MIHRWFVITVAFITEPRLFHQWFIITVGTIIIVANNDVATKLLPTPLAM
jgi:hypothetical protein